MNDNARDTNETGVPDPAALTAPSPQALLREIAYLYEETRRLGAGQSARLIAAAALSFCEEVPAAGAAALEPFGTPVDDAPEVPE